MNKKRLILGAVLSALGFAFSAYLASLYYDLHSGEAAFKSFCNMGQNMNCDAVAASPHAEFFSGVPLASFTSAWYVAIFIFFLLARTRHFFDEAIRTLAVMTIVSSAFSIYYIWILSSVLKTYCVLCIGIDFINFASLGIVLSLRPISPSKKAIDFSQWRTFAGILAGCAFVIVLAFKGMDKNEMDPLIARELANQYHGAAVQEITVDKNTPILGNPDAPITIAEFSDFQCPYCRKGATTLNSVLNRYPGKVRVAFKNYPLDPSCNPQMKGHGHATACEAARVVMCANKQGKFSEVYETLFEHQEQLVPGLPLKLAVEKGANEMKMKACLDSPEVAMRIQESLKEGNTLGVQGTPTFFLNGKKIDGGTPLLVWFEILDEMVKK